MRIAHVVPSLEARHGGPSRSVLGLSTALAAGGHEVALLTTEPGDTTVTQPAPGLTVRRFARQWPQSFAVSAPLRDHLSTSALDLIHYHSLWLRPLHYAANASRRTGRPLVISPRGMMTTWAWSHHRWKKFVAQHCLHPGALAHTAGWHATSSAEADDIRRLGFNQPICVSPNGVNIPDPSEIETARQYWLNRCPALGTRRVALFYSRFHAKKRVLELIDLWAVQAPADWLLLMVGIPEQYSLAELRARVLLRNCSDKIKVHDGAAAPAPYAVASLYLLPTHSENFGLTVAEALAHGVPVVTTDGTPWQGLETQDAGRWISWANFGPAMHAVMQETPGELARRGAHGRAWMSAQYSWSEAAGSLSGFYHDLTARE